MQVESEVQQSPALFMRQSRASHNRIMRAATQAALDSAASSSSVRAARTGAVQGPGLCQHVLCVWGGRQGWGFVLRGVCVGGILSTASTYPPPSPTTHAGSGNGARVGPASRGETLWGSGASATTSATALPASRRTPLALAGVRTWLRVGADGTAEVVQLERHTLERELGVQLRDFRVLDAVLGASYPSCILVRGGQQGWIQGGSRASRGSDVGCAAGKWESGRGWWQEGEREAGGSHCNSWERGMEGNERAWNVCVRACVGGGG